MLNRATEYNCAWKSEERRTLSNGMVQYNLPRGEDLSGSLKNNLGFRVKGTGFSNGEKVMIKFFKEISQRSRLTGDKG